MSNRGEVRALCRRRLGDSQEPHHWTDLQINQWINDAIADYSRHFPRELTEPMKLIAGTYEYNLATVLTNPQAILKIEYPLNKQPPEYLEYRQERDGRGFYGERVYDVQGMPPGTLILGPGDWATDAQVHITHHADHYYPEDDTELMTVPNGHLELIVLFVRMVALMDIAMQESQDTRTNSLVVGTLSLNANRAEREYRGKLEKYLAAASVGSQVMQWAGVKRIY